MTPSTLVRRRTPVRIAAVCVLSTGTLVLPALALAADTGGSTIVAQIGANGAVSSVHQISVDGASTSFTGQMPVTMSISRSVSGSTSTYHYHVENTWSRVQTVNFVDTLGKPHHTSVPLQLPLVAQLGVTLPSSLTHVSATGATITTDSKGAKHLLWNMVLFTPLGASTDDVSFSASGSGTPVAELRATPVDPNTTQGLSASGQAATAAFQQDDFWNGYAGGGNAGLTKLRDGVAQMVTGLQQLHDGIATAQGGAVQLDNGARKAYVGSRTLSAGLGKISVGADDLSTGLGKIHTGQGSLTTGLTKIHDGQSALTGGLTQIHDGQSALTTGLGQISGGLAQLADPTTGLQAAVTGLQAIQAGVGLMLQGVGPTGSTTQPGLLDGLALISGGLQQAQTNLTALDQGLQCANLIITTVANGSGGSAPTGPCWTAFGALPPLTGVDPVSQAVLLGLVGSASSPTTLAGAEAALNASLQAPTASNPNTLPALIAGVAAVTCGVSDGTGCPANTPGVKEGLQQVQAGLTQLLDPTKGLPAAVAGVNLLNAGAASALTGSQQLTAGSASALTGSQQLTDGSAAALAGSQQLFTGSGKAFVGSQQLADGAGQAFTGSKSLVSGLGKLSAGQHQVATGLPAAVSGTQQLLDGAKQVHDGIGQVQDGAVGPLATQLGQASVNAHKQLAVLGAAAALASQAPGGAHASYVLSQDTHGFRLAASVGSVSSGHTVRNVGVGLGGLALLVVGVLGGFAIGRRASVSV